MWKIVATLTILVTSVAYRKFYYEIYILVFLNGLFEWIVF